MMNDQEDILTKQKYLREQILDEGYDPQEFNDYMCSVKNEEVIDLSNWSLKEIIDVIKDFKEFIKFKQLEEKKKEEIQTQKINEEKNKTNSIKEEEQEVKQKINKDFSQTNSTVSLNISNDPFDYYKTSMKCEKLELNQITNRDDLYITICEPEKIKSGFFSIAYYQYTVKTYPLGFNVTRKISDFSFLAQKLKLINPVKYIPEIPTFSFGTKDNSPEKIRFIQNFMNLLIENRYIRTLQIFYDFITLQQNDWNDKVNKKYKNIEEADHPGNMPNFEGKYTLKITNEDEIKASNIKNDIYFKNEIYKNLDYYFDELLANLDKVSNNLKNISICFNDLQDKYNNNKTIKNCYSNLYNLFKTWSDDYILQKNIIRDEIKYFFLFINKELNTFLNNFENYRMSRDDYKDTFESFKINTNPLKEDYKLLKKSKKYYAFELIHVNSEYEQLEERQGKRLLNQFAKYNENVKLLFQDLENCYKLCNFIKNSYLKENIINFEINSNETLEEKQNKINKNKDKDKEKRIIEESEISVKTSKSIENINIIKDNKNENIYKNQMIENNINENKDKINENNENFEEKKISNINEVEKEEIKKIENNKEDNNGNDIKKEVGETVKENINLKN